MEEAGEEEEEVVEEEEDDDDDEVIVNVEGEGHDFEEEFRIEEMTEGMCVRTLGVHALCSFYWWGCVRDTGVVYVILGLLLICTKELSLIWSNLSYPSGLVYEGVHNKFLNMT